MQKIFFYCFTINKSYVIQTKCNTVLYCDMVVCCTYIAKIIIFNCQDIQGNKDIYILSNSNSFRRCLFQLHYLDKTNTTKTYTI